MRAAVPLSRECGIHRTTLTRAANKQLFPSRLDGNVWLIDEESPEFLAWLGKQGGRGRPRGQRKAKEQ